MATFRLQESIEVDVNKQGSNLLGRIKNIKMTPNLRKAFRVIIRANEVGKQAYEQSQEGVALARITKMEFESAIDAVVDELVPAAQRQLAHDLANYAFYVGFGADERKHKPYQALRTRLN